MDEHKRSATERERSNGFSRRHPYVTAPSLYQFRRRRYRQRPGRIGSLLATFGFCGFRYSAGKYETELDVHVTPTYFDRGN